MMEILAASIIELRSPRAAHHQQTFSSIPIHLQPHTHMIAIQYQSHKMSPLRLRQTNLDCTDNDTNGRKRTISDTQDSPIDSATDAAAAPRRTVHYPKLPSVTPAKPRLRKPGLATTVPSFISSPIKTPSNAGRKRANAISLSETPARQVAKLRPAHVQH